MPHLYRAPTQTVLDLPEREEHTISMSRIKFVPTAIAAAILSAGIVTAASAAPVDVSANADKTVSSVTTSYTTGASRADVAAVSPNAPTAVRPPFAPINVADKALAQRLVIAEELNWYYL